MWSSWTESAKASFQQALEKTGDVLEKTGDVLTNAAASASRTAREQAKKQKEEQERQELVAATTTGRYSNISTTATATTTIPSAPSLTVPDPDAFFKSFQAGWSSVVESTKAGIKHAQDVIEEQNQKLQQKIAQQSRPKPRDLKLPLDVAALQDANVVYLTDRIITMSHPAMSSKDSHGNSNGNSNTMDMDDYHDMNTISAQRKLAAVGHLLHKRHDGHFMVWNLSEVDYDTTLFDDQVLNYSFPGSPSPPLGLLLKLLISMESWLKADPSNVAVVHCLTGKGRTSTVVAAFLCWMKEAGFVDIYETLTYIAHCKQLGNNSNNINSNPAEDLTIPSQRRYAGYFKNMLDGIRPSQPPLLLQRVILSHAPKFAKGPGRIKLNLPTPSSSTGKETNPNSSNNVDDDDDDADDNLHDWDEEKKWGCVPYIQLFKAGQLVFTAPASRNYPKEDQDNENQEEEEEATTTTTTTTTTNTKDDNQNETLPSAPGNDKQKHNQQEEEDGETLAKEVGAVNADAAASNSSPERTKKKKKQSPRIQHVLPFCHVGDGSISFHVNQIVQGDVLLRCRHLTAKRARISMFRAAFHTGYIGGNVLRLTKAQLDGACNDDRFSDDFYMDVIFETIDAEEAGKLIQQLQQQDDDDISALPETTKEATTTTTTTAVIPPHSINEQAPTKVTASACDTMLDRDSRFWDVIDKRKQELQAAAAATATAKQQEAGGSGGGDTLASASAQKDNEKDPYWGPTVGRRRPLDQEQAKHEGLQQQQQQQKVAAGGSGSNNATSLPPSARATTTGPDIFSIGGEMDFLPQEPDTTMRKKTFTSNIMISKPKKMRDSLMEALTGALDDDDHDGEDDNMHVIIFSHDQGPEKPGGSPADNNQADAVAAEGKDGGVGTTTPTMSTDAATKDGDIPKSKPEATASNSADTTSPKVDDAAAKVVLTAQTKTTAPAAKGKISSTATDNTNSVDISTAEVDQLLSNAAASDDLNLDDSDMNALLAAAEDGVGVDDDDDDDDLQDLENLLGGKK